jgi:hypothetical protein
MKHKDDTAEEQHRRDGANISPDWSIKHPNLPHGRTHSWIGNRAAENRKLSTSSIASTALIEVDQSSVQRVNGGLSTITRSHFIEHGRYVNTYGFFSNIQLLRYLTVGPALRYAG